MWHGVPLTCWHAAPAVLAVSTAVCTHQALGALPHRRESGREEPVFLRMRFLMLWAVVVGGRGRPFGFITLRRGFGLDAQLRIHKLTLDMGPGIWKVEGQVPL